MVSGLYLHVSLDHAYTPRQSPIPLRMASASPLHMWPRIEKSSAEIRRSSAPSPPSLGQIYLSSAYFQAVYASRLEARILWFSWKANHPTDPGSHRTAGGSYRADPRHPFHRQSFRLHVPHEPPRRTAGTAPASSPLCAWMTRRAVGPYATNRR